MRIERIEDKKFQVTITEKEALKFSDATEITFHYNRLISNRIGSRLLGYITECCKFPHAKRPALDLEIFKDGY